MKNIMKEAHKMTREIKDKYPEVDYRTQLGLCMTYLLEKNEEEEKMVEIKGTEKQVKLAEKIREKLTKDAERMIADYKDSDTNISKKRTARCEAVLSHIQNETDAKWYIKYADTPAHGVGKDLTGI